jgi:DNA-binding SARP family transcriptional activator
MRALPRDRPPTVVVGVLGVVTLYGGDGAPVPLTDAERRLLAVLTAVEGDGATATQLEDAVWEGAPPRTARQSLHNHLHRLRAKLEGTSLAAAARRALPARPAAGN